MAIETQRRHVAGRTLTDTQVDQGLRRYMLGVYNYMASGLALTGITAYLVAHTGLGEILLRTGLGFAVMLAAVGVFLFMSFRIEKIKPTTAQVLYWSYSALMGAAISYILIVNTGETIARAFFITMGMFGAMSLYGYTTKRSLVGWGPMLMMGMIGLLIAIVVNWILGSELLQFVISAGVVVLFCGLTAWDTQRIKDIYRESDGRSVIVRKSVMGAIRLHYNFVVLFMWVAALLGGGRE